MYVLPRVVSFTDAAVLTGVPFIREALTKTCVRVGYTDVWVTYPDRSRVPLEAARGSGSSGEHKRCSRCHRMGHRSTSACVPGDDLMQEGLRHATSMLRFGAECSSGEIVAQALCLLGAGMCVFEVYSRLDTTDQKERVMPTVAVLFALYEGVLAVLTDPDSAHATMIRVCPASEFTGICSEATAAAAEGPTSRTTVAALNALMRAHRLAENAIDPPATAFAPDPDDDATWLPVFRELPGGDIGDGPPLDAFSPVRAYAVARFSLDNTAFRVGISKCLLGEERRIRCAFPVRRFSTCEACGFWGHMKPHCMKRSSIERIAMAMAVLHDTSKAHRIAPENAQIMMANVFCGLVCLLDGFVKDPEGWAPETRFGKRDRVHGPFEDDVLLALRMYNATVAMLAHKGVLLVAASCADMKISETAWAYARNQRYFSQTACRVLLGLRDAVRDPTAVHTSFWRNWLPSAGPPGSPLRGNTSAPPLVAPPTVSRITPYAGLEELAQTAAVELYGATPNFADAFLFSPF